jgi:hypothetical protein
MKWWRRWWWCKYCTRPAFGAGFYSANHGKVNSKSNHSQYFNGYGCECLTPFPLRFHWYCGGKFNRWWKPEYTNIPTACYNSMNVITYGYIEMVLNTRNHNHWNIVNDWIYYLLSHDCCLPFIKTLKFKIYIVRWINRYVEAKNTKLVITWLRNKLKYLSA